MRLLEIVADVRAALKAAGYPAYDAPPDSFDLPAAIVELLDKVTYHSAMKDREEIDLTVTVIVSRADAKDARGKLYTALSTEPTPDVGLQPVKPALENYAGRWRSLSVLNADTLGTYQISNTGQGLGAQFHISVRAQPGSDEEGS